MNRPSFEVPSETLVTTAWVQKQHGALFRHRGHHPRKAEKWGMVETRSRRSRNGAVAPLGFGRLCMVLRGRGSFDATATSTHVRTPILSTMASDLKNPVRVWPKTPEKTPGGIACIVGHNIWRFPSKRLPVMRIASHRPGQWVLW